MNNYEEFGAFFEATSSGNVVSITDKTGLGGTLITSVSGPITATVGGNGNTSGLTGYSIISADSLDGASKLAEGCPVLTSGGSVEVYEILPVM